mmetsp:Transcript_20483/g.40018  ORF Transcript_20483/g.40018 Transcript_20483/m.40018 type:complete len:203 (+) Transcript_20483:1725-2333(+)
MPPISTHSGKRSKSSLTPSTSTMASRRSRTSLNAQANFLPTPPTSPPLCTFVGAGADGDRFDEVAAAAAAVRAGVGRLESPVAGCCSWRCRLVPLSSGAVSVATNCGFGLPSCSSNGSLLTRLAGCSDCARTCCCCCCCCCCCGLTASLLSRRARRPSCWCALADCCGCGGFKGIAICCGCGGSCDLSAACGSPGICTCGWI